MEPEFDGTYGRQKGQKQGKTFYKGRNKQISRDRNPSQWSAYDKAPRIKHAVRHYTPLAKQLSTTRETGILSKKSLPAIVHENADDDDKDIDQSLLDANETDKILKLAKKQMDDNKTNDTEANTAQPTKAKDKVKSKPTVKITKSEELFQIESKHISLQDILGDDDDDDDDAKNADTQSIVGGDEQVGNIELTEQEEKALEMFMPSSKREQVSLADIIMKRITQKEDDNISQMNPSRIIQKKIPKQVITVYKDAGNIMAKWRSGRIPKALKIVPQCQDWEELLYITNPDEWTPAIVYETTKLFVSQSNAAICQRYFNTILLPRVREDILLTKKLNFHLYQAVRKSLFKSQAFFRGFLLPLCSDECRAREAVILGGVIQKNSIPVIQSALAMYKLLELEYSGPVHYFLRILLNKRYALPLKVIDALVSHFKKFENDPRQMPVIWHQTFLVFAERYKKSLTKQQRNSLKNVLKKQYHRQITPLIRKELFVNVQDKITSMDIDI